MKNIEKPNKFINLHGHSVYSTGDAIGYPSDHIDHAIKNEITSLAITDHGNMSSFANFYFSAKEKKKQGIDFKPLYGIEAYYHPNLKQWQIDYEKSKEDNEENIDDNSESTVKENEEDSKNLEKVFNPVNRRHHMVLVAKNNNGLKKLFSLVSKSFKEGFYRFPRIDASMLSDAKGDIICSSACISSYLSYAIFSEFVHLPKENITPDLLNDNIIEKILNNIGNEIDPIVSYLGEENVFLELQFNKLNSQHLLNKALIEFSKRSGLKLIATCDSHYYKKEVWQSREMYKLLSKLNQGGINVSMLPQNIEELKCELYPKNAQQIWDSYKEYCSSKYSFYEDELIKDAIERTYNVAYEMIQDIEPDVSIKLPKINSTADQTEFDLLVQKCKHGLIEKKLHKDPKYVSRLKEELKVIKEKGFSSYFLTMKTIFDIAEKSALTAPGRGSSAGSLINYVLGITKVDPIKYDLLFSRFLNKNRQDFPDCDQDFSSRETVIDKLKEHFGKDNVIPISNYNTLQLKSLIKDISKFYNIPFQEVNAITFGMDEEILDKIVQPGDNKQEKKANITYDDAINHCEKFRNFINQYPHVGEHIQVLHKQIRNYSKHAGGVIVADNVLDNMPVVAIKKEFQTPWTEGQTVKHLSPLGWVKFDLLGIETLRCFEKAIKLILEKEGIKNPTFEQISKWYKENLNPDLLNLEDLNVFENIYKNKRFANIFQFEEPHAQNFISALNPKNIEDIAAATSICRPGPLSSGVDKLYLYAKENPETIQYEHELVKKVLNKTYNTLIYQEQCSMLGKYVAGMSDGDCERLRKLTTKITTTGVDKAKIESQELEKMFIEGSIKNGIEQKIAENLFNKIKMFVAYAFNKCLGENTLISVYSSAGEFKENKKIKDIKSDEIIKSRNETEQKDIFISVKENHYNGKRKLYKFFLDNGASVVCTMDHKFRIISGEMKTIKEIIDNNDELLF